MLMCSSGCACAHVYADWTALCLQSDVSLLPPPLLFCCFILSRPIRGGQVVTRVDLSAHTATRDLLRAAFDVPRIAGQVGWRDFHFAVTSL